MSGGCWWVGWLNEYQTWSSSPMYKSMFFPTPKNLWPRIKDWRLVWSKLLYLILILWFQEIKHLGQLKSSTETLETVLWSIQKTLCSFLNTFLPFLWHIYTKCSTIKSESKSWLAISVVSSHTISHKSTHNQPRNKEENWEKTYYLAGVSAYALHQAKKI